MDAWLVSTLLHPPNSHEVLLMVLQGLGCNPWTVKKVLKQEDARLSACRRAAMKVGCQQGMSIISSFLLQVPTILDSS